MYYFITFLSNHLNDQETDEGTHAIHTDNCADCYASMQ